MLHHVVEKDQTCGIPGRYIGENVSLLRDLVDFTSESDTPAAILSLDQEKAFDRVDWAFMFKTLGRMGFGLSFIRWVRLLYTNVRSSVLINGYSSLFSFLLVVLGKVVPCRLSCTFLRWRSLPPIYAPSLTLWVCLCLAFRCPCRSFQHFCCHHFR